MLRLLLTGVGVLAVLSHAGCKSQPPVVPRGAPVDFSMDVVVIVHEPERTSPLDPPRLARYTLFADGSLHAGTFVRGAADRLPEIVRVLSWARMEALWGLCRQLGLTDPAAADPFVGIDQVEPGPGQVAYVVSLTGDGERWYFLRMVDAETPADPRLEQLMTRLGELAWSGDLSEERATAPPRRYDFGPDPYARFRPAAGP